jgi:hypothetical protein
MPGTQERYTKTFPISWDTESQFVQPIIDIK